MTNSENNDLYDYDNIKDNNTSIDLDSKISNEENIDNSDYENPIVKKAEYFLMKNYKKELDFLMKDYPVNRSLEVDFAKIELYDPKFADEILDNPDYILEAFRVAAKQYKTSILESSSEFDINIRLFNLPDDRIVKIKNLSSEYIGKLISIEGLVRQFTTVLPKIKIALWICKKCGASMKSYQDDMRIKKPSSCTECKHKDFELDEKESIFLDYQKIEIQEPLDDLKGGESANSVNIIVNDDLVNRFTAGDRILFTGILRLKQPDKANISIYGKYIDCIHIEDTKQEYEEVEISAEDEKRIKELSSNPQVYDLITASIAPHIKGQDKVKEAIALQLFGGVKKILKDKSKIRGNLHILLIGDPGVGKCLHKETKVMLYNGDQIRIEDLFNKIKKTKIEDDKYSIDEDLEVLSLNLDGKITKIKPDIFWKRKNKEDYIKIKTFSGEEITLTSNHPLFIHDNGHIVEIKAKDLKLGDRIASIKYNPFNGVESKFLNKVVDDKIARLFGYIIGDGYIGYTKTSGIVNFTSNDKNTREDFTKIIKDLFNYDVKEYSKIGTTAKRLEMYNKNFVDELLNTYPLLNEKADKKRIPEFILNSKENVIINFLRALFDCDSYVDISGKIVYTSKSEELINDIKLLLLRLRIQSIKRKRIKYATNTTKKTKREYFDLIISGKEALEFKQKIGFTTNKGDRIKLKINNTNYKLIPNVNKILHQVRTNHNIKISQINIPKGTYKHIEKGDRLPSKETLKKIINEFKRLKIKDTTIEKLELVINSDVYWDKIIEIKTLEKDEYSYDLQIPKLHNYIANGFIVHNSQMLQYSTRVAPKSLYVVGKTASGAGLTATAVKDEFGEGGWTLKAGALVLASGGFAMVDEFDKMSPEDRSAMHEAMEQESVSIAKAGIVTSFKTETSVLAAANPKYGRFDSYKNIAEQIEIPPTLMSRFDLFFVLRDLLNEKRDRETVLSILKTHQEGQRIQQERDEIKFEEKKNDDIDSEFLRKYISYARTKIFPIMKEDAIKKLQDYFIGLRKMSQDGRVTVTYRQLEALIRLSEANARVRLSSEVTIDDAQRSIDLFKASMEQVGMDPETGKMDIDIITTGQSHSQVNRTRKVLDIIENLCKDKKVAAFDEIVLEAEKENIDKKKVREIVDKLTKSGDIYEPRPFNYAISNKD